MRDEVGEHMALDLRPSLHAESLQILPIPTPVEGLFWSNLTVQPGPIESPGNV